MTVKELIFKLRHMPQDAEVVTNECEATHDHEEIVELDRVSQMIGGKVYIGTRGNDTTTGSGTVFGEIDVYGLKPD